MENNQPKKKNAGLTALIALLLIITTMASCIGIYAWAKYISSQDGNATASIAKWSFDLKLKNGPKNGSAQETAGPIDLADTIDFTHVKSGTIAPGTNGEFQVIVNTGDTETDVLYEVTIALANCPRNITFSRVDENNVTTVLSAGGASNERTRTLNFSKYLKAKGTNGNENGKHVETITWNWPFELTTGETTDKTNWDLRDKQDTQYNETNNVNVSMTITAKGTEMLEEPAMSVQSLAQAGTIKVGDYVNYTPSSESVTITAAQSGDDNAQTFSTANNSGMTWRVLSVDSNSGQVKIVGTPTSETLTLYGRAGFGNAETVLNSIASIYGGGTGAASVRSITEDDIFDAIGYGKVANYNGDSNTYESGEWFTETWNSTSGTATAYSTTTTTATAGNPVTLHNTANYSNGKESIDVASQTLENGSAAEKAAMQIYWDMLIGGNYEDVANCDYTGCLDYWCASRFVDCGSDSAYFCVRIVCDGGINGGYYGHDSLFDSNTSGGTYECSYSRAVVPVVTLQSNIGMEQDNNNVWNFVQ